MLSKAEAVKKIIDILEQMDPKHRYQAIMAVGTMYDPDPDYDGDGEEFPIYDRHLKAVGK